MSPRWVVLSVIALAACRRSSVQTGRPARVLTAPMPRLSAATHTNAESGPVAADAAPPADAASPTGLAAAKAWNEPAAVTALDADCEASPQSLDQDNPSPLACTLPFEQSCVPDPCHAKESHCLEACTATCERCATSCARTCGSCKARCAVGAEGQRCRLACAASTGSCRQGCLTTRDTCGSAGCAAGSERCFRDEAVKWQRNGCTGICPKVSACYFGCMGLVDERKMEVCKLKCVQGHPGCDVNYCIVGSPPEGAR